jgi:nucleoside-diphosphate-sugar epimerase
VRAFGEAGGERAVLAGTVSEYGESADGICRESDPAAPDNLYGRSKALLGAEALEVCAGLGVSAAWARIFFAYGPHEHPARLVSSVAISLLGGERARCSHGRQLRDYLYTRDIGAALARLLDSDLGGVINVGSGTVIELRELVALVAEAAGNPELVEFGAIPPGPAQAPRIEADVTRLRDELGFEPAYDHETGVRETVDWWRARLMAPATAPVNA